MVMNFAPMILKTLCKIVVPKDKRQLQDSPHRNRVTKRMNWSLIEKARSILRGARMEQKNWVEAIAIAYFLIN